MYNVFCAKGIVLGAERDGGSPYFPLVKALVQASQTWLLYIRITWEAL